MKKSTRYHAASPTTIFHLVNNGCLPMATLAAKLFTVQTFCQSLHGKVQLLKDDRAGNDER